MKRLLILRHAKSSWADSSMDDWERPLNERGERDAPKVGAWLRERESIPDVIVSSDAVRAITTARAVADAAGYTREIITQPSLYHAKPHDVIEVLRNVADDAATVLVVGHNPGLEDLVRQLSGEYHGLPTAALVDLEVPIEHWRDLDATAATIVEVWYPRERA
ncbi:MAG TPA: histidine phosphatase family protein [Vicinamibacterales bacterium]|nr:histidine phosphatase family protein [Vicinamibacterales bacterium]